MTKCAYWQRMSEICTNKAVEAEDPAKREFYKNAALGFSVRCLSSDCELLASQALPEEEKSLLQWEKESA